MIPSQALSYAQDQVDTGITSDADYGVIPDCVDHFWPMDEGSIPGVGHTVGVVNDVVGGLHMRNHYWVVPAGLFQSHGKSNRPTFETGNGAGRALDNTLMLATAQQNCRAKHSIRDFENDRFDCFADGRDFVIYWGGKTKASGIGSVGSFDLTLGHRYGQDDNYVWFKVQPYYFAVDFTSSSLWQFGTKDTVVAHIHTPFSYADATRTPDTEYLYACVRRGNILEHWAMRGAGGTPTLTGTADLDDLVHADVINTVWEDALFKFREVMDNLDLGAQVRTSHSGTGNISTRTINPAKGDHLPHTNKQSGDTIVEVPTFFTSVTNEPSCYYGALIASWPAGKMPAGNIANDMSYLMANWSTGNMVANITDN